MASPSDDENELPNHDQVDFHEIEYDSNEENSLISEEEEEGEAEGRENALRKRIPKQTVFKYGKSIFFLLFGVFVREKEREIIKRNHFVSRIIFPRSWVGKSSTMTGFNLAVALLALFAVLQLTRNFIYIIV